MEQFKKYIAYIPTWGFYWLGDLVSKPLHYHDIFVPIFHPLYNSFMGWSLFFNDWGGLDCWIEHEQDTEYDDE